MVRVTHFLTMATLASAKQSPVSGIQKVIKLLTDMKSTVEQETIQGTKDADAMENQCIEDQTKLEADVKYQTEKAEELKAHAENQAAKSTGYSAEASTLAPEIAALKESEVSAKKVRKDQEAVFRGEEAELVEANTVLMQAYSVLKRTLSNEPAPAAAETAEIQTQTMASLLQTAHASVSKHRVSEPTMTALVTALSAIVDSAWMDAAAQKRIKSFLEATSMSKDGSLDSLTLSSAFTQPQAAVSNYETKSGGILQAIADLQEKTASALSKLREADLDNKHKYEIVMQDLLAESEAKEKALAQAKQQAAECAAASGKAEENYSITSEAAEAAAKQLSESQADCKRYAEEWVARKASAEEEVVALANAIEILGGKFGMFLQLGNKDIDPREKAASLLRQLGRKLNQMELMQAAASAEADPFSKVRKMIAEMIEKLEAQSVEEASKEAKCQTDIKEGKMQVKVKGQQMQQLQARADAASASFSQLGVEIGDLSEEVKNLDAMRGQWTKTRNEQKSENEAVIKEAEESVEALNKAIGVLKDFYSGEGATEGTATMFLQTMEKIAQKVEQPKTEKAEAIIELLLTAQSDFEKMRQETEAAERDAQKSYENQQQEAEVSLAKKKALIEGKTKERAAFKVQILQIDEDLTAATEAYSAAGEYLNSREEACANKPMTYEERQAARQQEIEGLRTALNILSGEEAFIQTKKISLISSRK